MILMMKHNEENNISPAVKPTVTQMTQMSHTINYQIIGSENLQILSDHKINTLAPDQTAIC